MILCISAVSETNNFEEKVMLEGKTSQGYPEVKRVISQGTFAGGNRQWPPTASLRTRF